MLGEEDKLALASERYSVITTNADPDMMSTEEVVRFWAMPARTVSKNSRVVFISIIFPHRTSFPMLFISR